MKLSKYICGLAVGALALTSTSCGDDFLDRTPEGDYNIDNYYKSDAALDAASAPLYNRAWFFYNNNLGLAGGSMRANDCYNPSFMVPFTCFQVTAMDTYLTEGWYGLYTVVIMANSVIDGAMNRAEGCTDVSIRRNVAEARLMRGVAYFYMLRMWGSVILSENNEAISQNPNVPRHREEDVLEFIIRDFAYAAENLPATPVAQGRATKWAAEALLAKAYLCRSGWGKSTRDASDLELAKHYALDVITKSGRNLLDDYANLFKYKYNNNEESLLAMQWVPLGSWQEQNTIISTLTFNGGEELLGSGTSAYGVWGGPLATLDMLKQYEEGDTERLDACFFTAGTHYDYINIANGGYDYTNTASFIKKGVLGQNGDDNDNKIATMNSPLNTYIIRLADTYLTYAEACLGNDEVLAGGDGLDYYNKVRERAGLAPKASITLDDIIRERRCEFGGEWCNWYDMVTWYMWKPDKMLDYFRNQQRGVYCDDVKKSDDGKSLIFNEEMNVYPSQTIEINSGNVFFPYPETDVIQNPMLKEAPQPYNFKD